VGELKGIERVSTAVQTRELERGKLTTYSLEG